MVARIVLATAVLHNLCIDRGVPVPPVEDDIGIPPPPEQPDNSDYEGLIHPDGATMRAEFIRVKFGQLQL